MNRKLLCTFAAFALVLAALGDRAGAVVGDYGFDWVTIGDTGNPAYEGGPGGQFAGRGSVNYEYRMSRLQISTEQWLEFINIFAPQSDNPFSFLRPSRSGMQQVPGTVGQYELVPWIENAGHVPVQGITWREAAMYANWLHNDKSTEWSAITNGAYDASTFSFNPGGSFNDQLTRSPDARFWIPSLDEWIKAAHYDPNHGGPAQGGWWAYPNSSDQPPVPGPPGFGDTSAGIFDSKVPPWYIPLGSYPHVQSPWGLLDVSGAAQEWLEEAIIINDEPHDRMLSGSFAGTFDEWLLNLDLIYVFDIAPPHSGAFAGGLRLASAVPVPGPGALFVFMLAACRRDARARSA